MGDYPQLVKNFSHEGLIEHFHLEETDKQFIAQFRGDRNRHGVAVLLKSLLYLGYFPQHLSQVPTKIKSFIARQLDLYEDSDEQYRWNSGTRDDHFAQIRSKTGFRFPKVSDKADLENWLRQTGARDAFTFSALFECAILRLRSLRIELPCEQELTRIVNAAHNGFFSDVHRMIQKPLSFCVRSHLDRLLIVPEEQSFSTFEKLFHTCWTGGCGQFAKRNQKIDYASFARNWVKAFGKYPFSDSENSLPKSPK